MLPNHPARTAPSQAPSTPTTAMSPAALGLPPVLDWQTADVASFLTSLKCGHLAPVFEANDITGDVILELDMTHLKEMGVTRVGDRVRLQVGLKALKASTFTSAPRQSSTLWGSSSMGSGLSTAREVGALAMGPSRGQEDSSEPFRTITSHVRPSSSVNSHSRTASSVSGHRPAPLDILTDHVRDPRLPQVYQPPVRPSIPRSASAGNILPPPNSIAFSQAQTRPLGSMPDISAPSLTPRSSGDASLRPTAPLASVQHAPKLPHGAVGLPSNPKIAELSTSSAGGSFTERRAQRAMERQNISGWPSTAAQPNTSYQGPLLAVPGMAKPPVVLGVNGRPAPLASLSSHPFATTPATPSSPSYPPLSSSFPSEATRSTDSLAVSAAASSQATIAPSTSGTALRSAQTSPSLVPSLEDIKLKCVKFINPEDGHSRVVDVTDCSDGWEVLEKVLKKFGKWRENGGGARRYAEVDDSDEEEGKGGVVLDGWGVYLEGYAGEGIGHPLTEQELLSFWHAPIDSPARNRGLTLKRVKKFGNRKQVEKFFGETLPVPPSPTSPTYYGAVATPRNLPGGKSGLSSGVKKMNRASTISIMNGLGVNGLRQAGLPPPPTPPCVNATATASSSTTISPAERSPTSGSFLVNKGRKMYNFFGHRPPSELISTHLTDYFPKVQKKVLERTARNSMMRLSSGDNNSIRASWATGGEESTRFSSSSFGDSVISPRKNRISLGARSNASNLSGPKVVDQRPSSPPKSTIFEGTSEDVHGDVPRVSISTDGVSGSESDAESVDSRPPLLPPVDTSNDSWSESLAAYSPNFIAAADARRRNSVSSNSRMSLLSQFRKKKDMSDTASFLTVDEITAHVDSKRASKVPFAVVTSAEDGVEVIDDEDDEARTPAPHGRRMSRSSRLDQVMSYYESDTLGSDEGDGDGDEDEYSEEEDDEDEDNEGEGDDEAEEDEQGKAFMSEGGKRSFKWIKGALIGSGSFGSVFLGMDASKGLLMAVKQVDIPSGISANEERKKDMLNALEREIELLKELQHENIVQYLDSSIDASHLNIFLEYVPGGSVTALLSNYGAFEEALVRVFVRQTLQGLAYLHEKGIIHRDIKGANILVDNKGGIKISDFGISKKVESDLLENSNNRRSLQGTVFWMAPEVVKQTAHTTKADIWSVGCLVVEMLTGQRPWGRLDQMQVMFKIGSLARPEFPPDITPEADDFLEKTFMLDFHDRPTAVDLLAHAFIKEDLDLSEDA